MSGAFVIRCGLLLDGVGGPGRRGAAVAVADGQIAAVGPVDAVRDSVGADAPVLDAADATLVPGLIDAHAHTAWGLDTQPGWSACRGADETILGWAAAGAQSALAAGVTTLRDCGSPGLLAVRLRDAINSGALAGPRMLAAGPCLTTTAGHGEFIGICADTADELRRRVRELCRSGVDFIKVMASGGSMDPHTKRRQPQYSEAELRALVDDAHRLGLPVAAHCNATEAIRRSVAAGADSIEHCNWLGAEEGTIDYDPAAADEILRRGVFLGLNVEATVRPYSAPGDGPVAWTIPDPPANRWELHADIRERGGRILFTSDEFGPALGTFPSLLADAAAQLGLDAAEVVHRATAVAAAAIGLDHEIGRIAAGLRADLALFDGDLEADPSRLRSAPTVWRAGALAARNGAVAVR